jgi:hypothetical protein
MNGSEKKTNDEQSGMMIGGLIVLGIGVLFLLINLGIIPGFRVIWPIIMIIVGLALIVGSISRKKKNQLPG